MADGPVILDFSKAVPIGAPAPTPEEQQASTLKGAIYYGAQQNPDEYAKLLTLHKQTGIPPVVSQGNESEVKHAADVNSLDYEQLVADHPRTVKWASKPDNAAVAGVDEVKRVAGIEKNAGVMSAISPFDWYKEIAQRKLAEYPLTRWVLDAAGGTAGIAGNVLSAVGLHGDGPTKKNILQRIETGLEPEQVGLKSTPLDWLAKNVAPIIPAMIVSGGTSAIARVLGISDKAEKVLRGLSIGGMFTLDQAGRTYTDMASSGASADESRLAANRVGLINAPANALFGATDLIPFLRNNPVSTSLILGGATGASGQVSQNVVTGQPWYKNIVSSAIQGSAMQGGMHIGTEMFFDHLGQAIDAADGSKLKQRSPEAFHDAMQHVFEGDASLRIPVEQFMEYFHGTGVSAQRVAEQLGATNYAEAVVSGGEVEVPKADFLSKLDAEQQQGLFEHIVDPSTGLTLKEHGEARKELDAFIASGGPEKLVAEAAQADAETAASPEFASVKEELRQRYIDAGETPEVSETLATKDANVFANLAKTVGMKATELLRLYNPKVKSDEAPGAAGQLNQESIPHVSFDESGNIVDGDGRHRVIAALERGDNSIAVETKLRDGSVQVLHVDPSAVARKMGVTPESLRATDAQQNEYFRTLYQSAMDSDQPRGWFRVLPDGSYEIGRTSIGDLSTFVHEPAHGYLKIIGDLAKREDASDVLRGDYSKILDFLGAKDGEQLTTEQQEKWARANEQYLREGKAPSEGLKGVFQRFAVWLSTIYKKASDLGVELTDNIRGVFDRLYAAEEGVNRAESESGPRLFTSAEEAGWTDEQFKKYAESKGVEVEQAKAEILAKLNEAALREKTDSWREEEKNVREAMTAEIDRKPEYVAIRSLRKGKLEDGTELTLNREDLIKKYGEERVKALQKQHPGLYRNEGGVDAEIAAEVLGFDSADRMMKALETSPRRSAAIEEATKAYMTAKHGDIRYDGSLNDQARIALENEKRAQNLHSELSALRRQMAKLKEDVADQKEALRKIAVAPLEAYREAARQMVDSKAIADLQPHRYLDASRKYSREAFDSLRKGDVEEAATAKHKELMNHFLFREATRAHDLGDRIETYAKKMSQVKELRKLGLAGQPYLEQIQALLDRFGFSKHSLLDPNVPRQESLSQFITRMREEEGVDLPIDPALLNETLKANYRNIPFSQLESVYDAMRAIDHAAKVVNSVRAAERRVAIATAASDLNIRLEEAVGKPEVRTSSDRARSFLDRVKDVNLDIAVLLPEFMFERFDGLSKLGPWHDYFWNRYNDASDHLNRLREMVFPKIMEYRGTKVDRSKKFYIESIGRTLTKDDIISIALNSGNESNLEKQMRGGIQFEKDEAPLKLSEQALHEILGHLTPDEIKMVNGIWDTISVLKPEAAALERKRSGIEPKWIEPKPLTIANGELKGGYYPLKYDPRFSAAGEKQSDASTVTQMFAKYAPTTTRQGYLKGRTEFFAPLTLDWQATVSRHLDEVAIDISHWEFASDAQRLLKNADVKGSIIRHLGNVYYKNLLDWVRYTVNQDSMGREASNNLEQFRRAMRNKVSTAVLGLRVGNAIAETAITPVMALQHVSVESAFKGAMTYMRNPMEATKFATSASDYVKRIDTEVDRNITEALHDLAGEHSLMADIRKFSIWTRVAIWKIGAVMAWHQGYADAMRQGLEGKDAVHVADSIYRMTQESGRPGDLSAVQRDPLWKEMTMFIGPSLIQYNNIRRSVAAFKDQGFNSKTVALGLTTLLAGHVMNNVVFNILRGKGPEDKDKWPAWLAARMTFGLADGFPLARDFAGYAEGKVLGEKGKDIRLSPVFQLGKDSVDAAVTTTHALEGTTSAGKAIKQDVRAVGGWTGLPVVQGSITAQYIYDVLTGQYKPEHPWSPVTDIFYARPKK
jgi:hypothetical protein